MTFTLTLWNSLQLKMWNVEDRSCKTAVKQIECKGIQPERKGSWIFINDAQFGRCPRTQAEPRVVCHKELN